MEGYGKRFVCIIIDNVRKFFNWFKSYLKILIVTVENFRVID